ncbi:M50 family metallopeptidase [Leucobacter albus]|uniref:M50 family metallopeptidase n=1 Tax=Leucobacter albus TaxID=272210 RepID=A0ABW3TR59_9MICO
MTTVLLYALGILIIVLLLGISIALHEIGHLIPAKLFGVKVTQYMIGFGRTIWSRKKGETEYGVKLLPLGGYVAMIGMYPPAKPGEAPRESTTGFLNSVVEESPVKVGKGRGEHIVDEITRVGDVPAGEGTGPAGAGPAGPATGPATGPAGPATGAAGPATGPAGPTTGAADEPETDDAEYRRGLAGWVDEAREASAETIGEGEDHRSFYRLPVWKKIIVMAGGPLMNLVLAFVFFGIVISGFGVGQSSTTLVHVSECLVQAGSTQTECGADDPAAPAAAAGLQPGDTLVSVDGTAIEGWEQFRQIVAASPGRPLSVQIERAGSTNTLSLTPEPNERVLADGSGKALLNDDGTPKTETVGMIGATPGTETVQRPITEVPAFVGENVKAVSGIVINLPARLVDVWQAAFGAEERDPNGPMGVVGVGRLAGEIVSMDEAPIAARAQFIFSLAGSLNVALFVFNLVPLMPLDGGHIAGAIYEAIKRGWAKLRRKPDPGPVDTAKMVPITFVVVIALGAMSLLLMYADIVKPVSFFG